MNGPSSAKGPSERDEKWLGAVFDAHAGEVHRYARRRLHGSPDPQSDADDITAEVFAITWRRRHEVDEPVLAWLYGVARRVLAAHRRRIVPLPVDSPIDGQLVDGRLDDGRLEINTMELVTDDLVLKQAWAGLSERDRDVLLLASWEGLNEEQIAVVLGVSVGGASSALSRARRRFRDALASAESGQADPVS